MNGKDNKLVVFMVLKNECDLQGVSSLIKLVLSIFLLIQRNKRTSNTSLSFYKMRAQTHRLVISPSSCSWEQNRFI